MTVFNWLVEKLDISPWFFFFTFGFAISFLSSHMYSSPSSFFFEIQLFASYQKQQQQQQLKKNEKKRKVENWIWFWFDRWLSGLFCRFFSAVPWRQEKNVQLLSIMNGLNCPLLRILCCQILVFLPKAAPSMGCCMMWDNLPILTWKLNFQRPWSTNYCQIGITSQKNMSSPQLVLTWEVSTQSFLTNSLGPGIQL